MDLIAFISVDFRPMVWTVKKYATVMFIIAIRKPDAKFQVSLQCIDSDTQYGMFYWIKVENEMKGLWCGMLCYAIKYEQTASSYTTVLNTLR